MVNFEDLRDWIDQAKKIDELAIIEGADIKYEIGAICQLSAKNQGQAILHRKIKGFPPNHGVITNLLSSLKNINLTYGLPTESSIRDTVEAFRKKIPQWTRDAENFHPRVVESGTILENVVEGEAINLNVFPVPLWHELDGGPYIGTADLWITMDPDTGLVNCGNYRAQLHDGKSVGMMATHGHHGRFHRQKYFDRGQPCPAVLVVGQDPLLFANSASPLSVDLSELDFTGAVRGRPLPVIKGRATGLPIPANAEIAIEGFIDPGAMKKEGKFGEWQGYYAGDLTDQPFLRAVTLYYRNDPILTGAPPAKPPYDDAGFWRSVFYSALLYNDIAGNVPGVKGVWRPVVGGGYYMQVISIKQQYGGHATHAGHALAHCTSGAYNGRYTIVVDDDIDPYDLEDVMWAVCTRSLPTDADIIKKPRGSHSDPLWHRTPARAGLDSTNPRAIIYAVKPYEWRQDFAPVNIAGEELRKEVFARWKDNFNGRLKTI
ncbi:MAG: UbiD family decarboxylase [Chloroflexi bacterium]|nr:UbiD family decarboxylase [Chloroflexota bacterium]